MRLFPNKEELIFEIDAMARLGEEVLVPEF